MEKIIEIPDGIDVTIEKLKVTIKGKKGENVRDFDDPRYNRVMKIEKKDGNIIVSSAGEKRKEKAMLGTITAHIKNMIAGAGKGYKYIVKINSSHFPMTVEIKSDKIIIKNFIGERGLRSSSIISGVKAEVQKDSLIITGSDKEAVAQTAANVEMATRLSRKDRRIFGDGCFIEGKFIGENNE